MEDCLAVVADQGDFVRRDFQSLAGVECGLGVELAEAGVELAEFAGTEGILFGYAQDFFADCWWEILFYVAEEIDF